MLTAGVSPRPQEEKNSLTTAGTAASLATAERFHVLGAGGWKGRGGNINAFNVEASPAAGEQGMGVGLHCGIAFRA